MSDEIITKRLHVSGITPAISPDDLSARLGSFGTVKALDGFGTLNAVGEPRKFGYVTIETTQPKLAKCMNLLSGVTWKGAKLRLGEAKPDFRERIGKEKADTPPARKKRRLAKGVQGVHALDMSLVTPENVHERGGWRVTPLGRIIRPIRIRPEHPLPDPLIKPAVAKLQNRKKKGTEKETKQRQRDPPTRARRRTIDPTKWESQHLKGIFLEGVVSPSKARTVVENITHESSASDGESGESSEEKGNGGPLSEEKYDAAQPAEVVEQLQTIYTEVQRPPSPPTTVPSTISRVSRGAPVSDLREENKSTLTFLHSLFGDRGDDDDWGGAESIGSDVDMREVGDFKELDEEDGAAAMDTIPRHRLDVVAQEIESSSDADEDEDSSEAETESRKTVALGAQPQIQKTKLKDLFAPREEEAGFSLLGHLELEGDLDIDEDILGLNLDPSERAAPTPIASALTPAPSGRRFQVAEFSFDANLPLFFPLPLEDRGPLRGKVKDPFDVAKEKGWDWRTFCRTETDEEIKRRWEDTRGELTRDWKRRHREAVKSRRRRGGLGGDDHE